MDIPQKLSPRPPGCRRGTGRGRRLPGRTLRRLHHSLLLCLWGMLLLSLAAVPRGRAAEPAGSRLVGFAGAEIEGLEQVLGDASFFVGDVPTQGTPEDVIESLRLRERDTDLMVLAALEYYSGHDCWSPVASGEVKIGEQRRVVTADGRIYLRGDASRGLSLQNLFFWDEQRDEDRSTGQDLTYLRWTRPLGGDRTLSVRGAFDVSWASGDTLAALFDYRRASLRLGLGHGQAARTRWALELGHKWVSALSSGAYDMAVLEWSRGDFGQAGSSDIEARVERRVYQPAGRSSETGGDLATLGSYWDGEIYLRFSRAVGRVEFEPRLRISGTLYDDSEEDDLGGTYQDRVRAEFDLLLNRSLLGAADLTSLLAGDAPQRSLESIEIGIGPVVDLLRVRGADGDFLAAGGRIRLSGQGGQRLGRAWLDLGIEVGRRNYRGDGADLVFDYDGVSFSLAQTDYTYYEISAIGGGRLPLGLEWESYLSLDQETHTDAADDGKLISFSFALRRSWCLLAMP